MAGCFGNHPEDRAMQNELNRHLDKQEEGERRAAQIDAVANDLYKAKLHSLVTYRKYGANNQYQMLQISDAIAEIRDDELYGLAVAVRDNNELEAGKAIIKLVTDVLRREAEEEAEDFITN